MSELLKISGQTEEIKYLNNEIHLCFEKMKNINLLFDLEKVKNNLIKSNLFENLLVKIESLKNVRQTILINLFEEELKIITESKEIEADEKVKMTNIIKLLYVPYGIYREKEQREKLILKI
jgi:hypothetical protein